MINEQMKKRNVQKLKCYLMTYFTKNFTNILYQFVKTKVIIVMNINILITNSEYIIYITM